ncbi:hypothetical protein HMPREF3039_02299 [Akkermansia sp. KLE1798]|nr:hypothetical protein HMPREF3039_02299 [Akkermansia sp. KLE1798]KZA05770.1 hypothetical protein HMPREF1326_00597 [Akkermansia sp. KLE1605]
MLDSYILLVRLETREFEPFVEPFRPERFGCAVRILIRHSISVKYSDYCEVWSFLFGGGCPGTSI